MSVLGCTSLSTAPARYPPFVIPGLTRDPAFSTRSPTSTSSWTPDQVRGDDIGRSAPVESRQNLARQNRRPTKSSDDLPLWMTASIVPQSAPPPSTTCHRLKATKDIFWMRPCVSFVALRPFPAFRHLGLGLNRPSPLRGSRCRTCSTIPCRPAFGVARHIWPGPSYPRAPWREQLPGVRGSVRTSHA